MHCASACRRALGRARHRLHHPPAQPRPAGRAVGALSGHAGAAGPPRVGHPPCVRRRDAGADLGHHRAGPGARPPAQPDRLPATAQVSSSWAASARWSRPCRSASPSASARPMTGCKVGWPSYRASADPVPLDQFFARLFGEVLSQPGYGFHQDYDAARIANQLVESARNFRWALENTVSVDGWRQGRRTRPTSPDDRLDWRVRLGREYVQLFESGALGALYVPGWRVADDAVFLAPAYTFLMRNQRGRRPVLAGHRRRRLVGTALPAAHPSLRALAPLVAPRAVERRPRVRARASRPCAACCWAWCGARAAAST